MKPAPSAPAPIDGAQFIDAGGVRLEMLRVGEGRPLLFLPGMDGIEGTLELIGRLAAHFKVFAVSPPGFGASELPANVASMDDASYVLLDLVDRLALRDAAMVGMSLGGWLAAEMLVKNASAFAHLVLGAPLGLKTADRTARGMADIFMLTGADADRLQFGTPQDETDPATLSDDALRRVLRNREAVSLFGWSPYLNNPKLAQRLHRIALPTLVLWGSGDALVPAQTGEAFAAHLPDARLELLEGAGHRIYLDRPPEVAERIVRFATPRSDRMKEPDHEGLAV